MQTPWFWIHTLRTLFGVQETRLAVRLWEQYPKSQALTYQLLLCSEPARSPEVARDRVRQLSRLLEARYLLRAAERLAPPNKPPRPKAIRAFEQRVLAIVGPDGKFVWTRED
jgi:hypothetical protein